MYSDSGISINHTVAETRMSLVACQIKSFRPFGVLTLLWLWQIFFWLINRNQFHDMKYPSSLSKGKSKSVMKDVNRAAPTYCSVIVQIVHPNDKTYHI